MGSSQNSPEPPIDSPGDHDSVSLPDDLQTDDQQKFPWFSVTAAVLVGVVLRMVFVAAPARLTGDEIDHYQGSVEVAHDQSPSVVPFRPPAYVYFGGMVLRIFGENPDYIRYTQILLEVVTILAIIRLGQLQFGLHCGVVAGWLYAISPEQIGFSNWLWTESLLCLMIVAGWLGLCELHRQPRLSACLVTGATWGILALLKPYNLYFFLPLVALCFGHRWVTSGWRRLGSNLGWACLVVLVQLCVVAPWCDFSEPRPVIISSQGRRVIDVGTNYYPPPQVDFSYFRDIPPEQRARARRVGPVWFILQNPGLFVTRTLEKMTNLWAPNSYVIRHIYSGHYGTPYAIPPYLRVGIPLLTMLAIGVVLIWATFGMVGAKIDYFLLSVACYMGCTAAMIALAVSVSRYRVPLMPLLMIFAAYFLTDANCGKRIFESEDRSRTAVASISFLLLLWAYRVPAMVLALW